MNILISGQSVEHRPSTLQIDDAIDERSTASLVVIDAAGNAAYTKGQPIEVRDDAVQHVVNGGFEDGLTHWRTQNLLGIDATASIDNVFVRSGNGALSLELTDYVGSLINGGFEVDLANWTAFIGSGLTGSTARTTAEAFAGVGSLDVNLTASTAIQNLVRYQDTPVILRRPWFATVRVKGSAFSNATANLFVRFLDANLTFLITYTATTVDVSGEWIELILPDMDPPINAAFIRLELGIRPTVAGGTGRAFFDEVALYTFGDANVQQELPAAAGDSWSLACWVQGSHFTNTEARLLAVWMAADFSVLDVAAAAVSTVDVSGNFVRLELLDQIAPLGTSQLRVELQLHALTLGASGLARFDDVTAVGPGLVWSGYIERPRRNPFQGLLGRGLYWDIMSVDNHYLADKRILARAFQNTTCGAIVRDIVDDLLDQEGITYTAESIDEGPDVEQALFNYIPASRALESLAERANFWFFIDKYRVLWFKDRDSMHAPWVATSLDMRKAYAPQLEESAPQYRNKQYVKGATTETDVDQVEITKGDGEARAFALGFPPATVSEIAVSRNGAAFVPETIGVKGIDSDKNRQWLWAFKSETISQNFSETVLAAVDRVRITYRGIVEIVVISQRPVAIAERSIVEGVGSGIVEWVDDQPDLRDRTAAFEFAESRLTRYGRIGKTLKFTTLIPGLQPGQLLTVDLPEYGLSALGMLIESVRIFDHNRLINYEVQAVEGTEHGSWAKFFGTLVARSEIHTLRENIGENQALIIVKSFSKDWQQGEVPNIFNALFPAIDLLPSPTLFPMIAPTNRLRYVELLQTGPSDEMLLRKVLSTRTGLDTDIIDTMVFVNPAEGLGSVDRIDWYGGSLATLEAGSGTLVGTALLGETKSIQETWQIERQDRKWTVGSPTPPAPNLPNLIVALIAKEIGSDGNNNTMVVADVGGADLGSVFDWTVGGQLRTYIAFGDTFSSFQVVPATGHRQNTLAYTTDTNPADGITFNAWITDTANHAKQLFASSQSGTSAIPTHGVSIGNAGYLYCMEVSFNPWVIHRSIVQKSTDGGNTWTRITNLTWTRPSKFGQVNIYKLGGFVYIFGIPEGRAGGVCLMRVTEANIENKAAYQYLINNLGTGGEWVTNDESQAITIVPAPVGEFSVAWNEFLQKYIMLYIRAGAPPSRIEMRVANNLWGPWSNPTTVLTHAQFSFPYAPFTKDSYVANGGQTVYFRMSRFDNTTFVPYSTYWMRADLTGAAPLPPPAAVFAAIGDTFGASPNGTAMINHTATGPDGGFTWTAISTGSAGYTIQGGQLELSGSSALNLFRANRSLNSPNQLVQVQVISWSEGGNRASIGLFGRQNGTSTQTFYYGELEINNGVHRLRIYKCVAGVFTVIAGPTTVTWIAGQTFKLELTGDSIRLYQDTTQRLSVVDSTITVGNFAGMGRSQNVNVGPVARLDNFLASTQPLLPGNLLLNPGFES